MPRSNNGSSCSLFATVARFFLSLRYRDLTAPSESLERTIEKMVPDKINHYRLTKKIIEKELLQMFPATTSAELEIKVGRACTK